MYNINNFNGQIATDLEIKNVAGMVNMDLKDSEGYGENGSFLKLSQN